MPSTVHERIDRKTQKTQDSNVPRLQPDTDTARVRDANVCIRKNAHLKESDKTIPTRRTRIATKRRLVNASDASSQHLCIPRRSRRRLSLAGLLGLLHVFDEFLLSGDARVAALCRHSLDFFVGARGLFDWRAVAKGLRDLFGQVDCDERFWQFDASEIH